MNSLQGPQHNVQIVCQPNVWSYKKIVVVTAIGAVALAAITAGIILEGGAGTASICFFSGGCTVALLDTAICFHSFWKLNQFYRAVKSHELQYPFERFESTEHAFDFKPFVVKENPYVVIYIKDNDSYSAVFFLNSDYFFQRLNALLETHKWVTPNQF
jgi:hypothetical protein